MAIEKAVKPHERGQALVELAVGMFTLALVVSAAVAFTFYIAEGLKVQNSVRSSSLSADGQVEVGAFAAEWLFGEETLDISENIEMPAREIL
jgi:hypothetical protein